MQSGNLRLDTVVRKAFLGDEELHLSDIEFDILAAFVEHKGTTVERQWLLKNVVRGEVIYRVDIHIKWLREKIEQDLSNPRIAIVRGVGYRFEG